MNNNTQDRPLRFRQEIGGEFHYWGYGVNGSDLFIPPADPSLPSDQYTGFQDIHESDIYERDRLAFPELSGTEVTVSFKNGRFVMGNSSIALAPQYFEIVGVSGIGGDE